MLLANKNIYEQPTFPFSYVNHSDFFAPNDKFGNDQIFAFMIYYILMILKLRINDVAVPIMRRLHLGIPPCVVGFPRRSHDAPQVLMKRGF